MKTDVLSSRRYEDGAPVRVEGRALPVRSASDTGCCILQASGAGHLNKSTRSAVLSDRARSPQVSLTKGASAETFPVVVPNVIKSVSVRPTDHLVDFTIDWKVRKYGDLV